MSLRTLGVLVLAIVAVFAAGCRRDVARQDKLRVRLMVATATSLIHLPVVLAQDLGYFRDEGLDVSLEDVGSGSRGVQGLLGGSGDVLSAFAEVVVQLASEGRDLRAFQLLMRRPATALVASPALRKAVRNVRELKGRTVAVTSPGSPTHWYLNAVLRHSGLIPGDVTVIAAASQAARIAALEHGKVDAAIVGEPGLTVLRKRHPQLLILADLQNPESLRAILGSAEYPNCVLIARQTWLRDNPETVGRLTRAVLRAARWAQEHPAREIATHIPRAMQIGDRAVYEEAIARVVQVVSRDGVLSSEGMEAVRNMMASSDEKVRQAKLDISILYTNEFVAGQGPR